MFLPALPPGLLQPVYRTLLEWCIAATLPWLSATTIHSFIKVRCVCRKQSPSKCIHPGPCINLAKAQMSVRSNTPCSGFTFYGCILFIHLTLTDSRTVKCISALYPRLARLDPAHKEDLLFHHPSSSSQGTNIRLNALQLQGV